jgi:hypothetical protein
MRTMRPAPAASLLPSSPPPGSWPEPRCRVRGGTRTGPASGAPGRCTRDERTSARWSGGPLRTDSARTPRSRAD